MKKIVSTIWAVCFFGVSLHAASSSSGPGPAMRSVRARTEKKQPKTPCDRCPVLARVSEPLCWEAVTLVLCSPRVRERLQLLSRRTEDIVHLSEPANIYDLIFDDKERKRLAAGYAAGFARMLKLWAMFGGSSKIDFCRFYLPHVFFHRGYEPFEINFDTVTRCTGASLLLTVQNMYRKRINDPLHPEDAQILTQRSIEHLDFALLQTAYDMDDFCLRKMAKAVDICAKMDRRHPEESVRALRSLKPKCSSCRKREFAR